MQCCPDLSCLCDTIVSCGEDLHLISIEKQMSDCHIGYDEVETVVASFRAIIHPYKNRFVKVECMEFKIYTCENIIFSIGNVIKDMNGNSYKITELIQKYGIAQIKAVLL